MSNRLEHPFDQRTIRVFVSSTFRDMQAERDELVLKIFPQLRRLCEERGVTWGEIDLRWGITEEQSQRGEVLPICLEEIKRCRPYFIGLLGERYGWIPTAISDEVLEREPWIKQHADGANKKSVTELEILHGVLNNPEMADHAFFYFRDPKFIDSVPTDSREDFTTEGSESTEKLRRLKEDIRQKHREGKLKYEPRENYPDAKSLSERVLADFTAMIDRLYPIPDQPTPQQRERMDHDAFARSRASVYIGRQEYFDRLDAQVASDAAPLVVLGESGSGKSALLANWFLDRFRPSTLDSQPSTPFALLHFIGASPDSANAIGLLRRIMLELKEHFKLPDDVPTQADKIREEFPNWLANVATRGPIVLVLDALNQLEDVDAAPDLGWLPRVFPKNCRVIVSTISRPKEVVVEHVSNVLDSIGNRHVGNVPHVRSLNAIEQRGWLQSSPPLLVHPLDEPERRRLIHDFLKQHTRDLGPARTDVLARAPQTTNPLYLRVLLNELRVFGRHEQLSERIDWYLDAPDPYALYRKVISRWEEAYSDGTDLVRDSLSLLWAARRGLSEAELTEALGTHGRPLPSAAWSPLHLAMSDALVSRSGLLTFAHDFLRTAVRDAYLPDELQQQTAHRQLAEYFQQQAKWNAHKVDELPWQLENAREWKTLFDVLTEEGCFLSLMLSNEYELLGYWLRLQPTFDLTASYTAAFLRWEESLPQDAILSLVAGLLGRFFDLNARYSDAETMLRRACELDEQAYGSQHPKTASRLSALAKLLLTTNRLAEAEPLMRRVLAINELAYGDRHPEVASSLNNLSQLLNELHQLEEAELLLRRALAIEEQSYGNQHLCVAIPLNNLAALLLATNRMAEAEPLMRVALAIEEKTYGSQHPNVARCLNNLAQLLTYTNRNAEAEPLMRRALAIDEQSYGNQHPNVATNLNNLASLLQASNRLAEAEPLMRQVVTILESAYDRDHPLVAAALNNLAQVLKSMNRLSEAEPLLRRALSINETSYGDQHPNVATSLNNLSQLLHDSHRLAEAEQLMRRALAIDEQSYGDQHPHVARDLNNLAFLLQDTNRLVEVEPLLRRALTINERSFGDQHPEVARSLNNLAQLFKATNHLAQAEPLIVRALAINEQSYGADHPDVAICLINVAGLLQATNRPAEAEPLMRRALAIFERSVGTEHPNVATALNNLAGLLLTTNRVAEAEPLMRRTLAINERSYGVDHPDVANRLNELALFLHSTNRLTEAAPLFHRALAIYSASFGADHPDTIVTRKYLDRLIRKLGSTASHPYLELLVAKLRQGRAIAVEDYLTAAKRRDEMEHLEQSHDFAVEFGIDSLRLLERLVALRCIGIPVKRAVGGSLMSAVDGPALIAALSTGIEFVADELEEFEDIQFQELCNQLEYVDEAKELYAALGLSREAEESGSGLGPDAWLEYAAHVNTRADRWLYCLAQRFVQSPPTKDEAFQLAQVFDHLGQPFSASALRDRFSTEFYGSKE